MRPKIEFEEPTDDPPRPGRFIIRLVKWGPLYALYMDDALELAKAILRLAYQHREELPGLEENLAIYRRHELPDLEEKIIVRYLDQASICTWKKCPTTTAREAESWETDCGAAFAISDIHCPRCGRAVRYDLEA